MYKNALIIIMALACRSALAELHDPTMPDNLPQPLTEEPSGVASPLKLNAIWISATSRRAVINGATVKIGQTLSDGSRLIKIHPHYVLIRNNTDSKKLFLVPSVKNQVK